MDPSSELLSRWHFKLECISDERFFSKLRVLDYPTNMAAGMEILLGCIQWTSTKLVVMMRDRYLQDREVKIVFDAASSCPNLTYLSMNIRRR